MYKEDEKTVYHKISLTKSFLLLSFQGILRELILRILSNENNKGRCGMDSLMDPIKREASH